MTNKEAIERLNLMQERCCNGYDAEAIYIAIKVLEENDELNSQIEDLCKKLAVIAGMGEGVLNEVDRNE